MRHIIYIISVITLFAIAACEDEKNDSQLITSTTQLTFPAKGGSQTLQIESNTDWRITKDVDWISISPSIGSMNQTIAVTVALSENELEHNAKVVISTKDGEKVVNLNVKVEGAEIETGKSLSFPQVGKIFGGKAHAQDSLEVKSNITWEVRGPEWLEVWDGSRWRPLSKERGTVRNKDKGMLYLRTAKDNKEDARLRDVITISEYLTGEYKQTLDVSQLGRLEVLPDLYMQLFIDGFVFGWNCGCDVNKIYYLFTDDMNKQIQSMDEFRNAEVTDTSYINSKDNLQPNTFYKWLCVGEDSNGNLPSSGEYQIYSMHTLPDENTSAKIYTGYMFEENHWTFYVTNEKGMTFGDYGLYATNNPNSAFRYSTPILALIMMRQEIFIYEGAYVRSKGWINYWPFSSNTNEVHALSKISNGNHGAKYFRYDRYYDVDGKRLPDKPLVDRIPKAKLDDPSLR